VGEFSVLHIIQTSSYTLAISKEVKQKKCEAIYSPASNAKFTNAGDIPLLLKSET
jgi:hypothetical protein